MMNNNVTTTIDVNSVINGKFRSMTLGQVIDMFSNLLISNDPRKDQFETVKTEKEINPRFIKTEWYSHQLLRTIQTFPCNKMIIRKDGIKVFESDMNDIISVFDKYSILTIMELRDMMKSHESEINI